MSAERVPAYAEWPDYGVYPCDNEWHTSKKPYLDPVGKCPDCLNTWWAADGTECPEDYALVAEIETLRRALIRIGQWHDLIMAAKGEHEGEHDLSARHRRIVCAYGYPRLSTYEAESRSRYHYHYHYHEPSANDVQKREHNADHERDQV